MQIDISCIETYIMSQICWDLHKLGYHPFTLHDAIYLSETENRKVTEAGIRVEDLFWRYFESLTTDDLAEILREVRNEKNAKLAAEEETKSAKNSKKSQKTCTPLPCDSQNSASK